MTTSTLGITQVAAAQNQKEVTINEADQALEDLSSLTTDLTITASTTLTAAQYRSGIRFRLGGSPAANFNLRLPANERLFFVTNNTGKQATVGVDPAADGFDGTTVIVDDGKTALIICDGTDCISFLTSAGATAGHWDINAQSGTAYTLALSDKGKLITLSNASPITLTVEDAATVPGFVAGDWVRFVQLGSGVVTVTGSGAGINSFDAATDTAGQYAAAVLVYLGSDVWLLEGNVVA